MNHSKTRLVLALLFFGAAAANAEVAIIVNPAYSGRDITADFLADIYLGKNRELKPVAQSKGSPDRTVFLSEVLGMNESTFKRYWSKLIFSGKGRPPNNLHSAEAVLAFVAQNENAIGYVDASLVDDSVKVAMRTE